MSRRYVAPALSLLKVLPILALSSCVVSEPGTKDSGTVDKVDHAHAEKVVEAGRAALGHDKFTVCYIDGGGAMTQGMPLVKLNAILGPTDLVRNTAQGLLANYAEGVDVVVDGPDAARANRTLADALKSINQPLNGLDLAVQGTPSAELATAAAQRGVGLHRLPL